jgi:hypothetical protein
MREAGGGRTKERGEGEKGRTEQKDRYPDKTLKNGIHLIRL